VQFEKAIGIFSAAYVKIARQFIREGMSRLTDPQKMFLNFGVLDGRLMQNQSVVEVLEKELQGEYESKNFEIYYLHEWLAQVARRRFPLTSDVAQVKAKTSDKEAQEKMLQKIRTLEKELGDLYMAEDLLMKPLTASHKVLESTDSITEKLKAVKELRTHASRVESALKEQNTRLAEIENIRGQTRKEGGEVHLPGVAEDQVALMREEFDILITVMRSCAVRGGIVKNTPILIDRWIPLDTHMAIHTKAYIDEKLSEFECVDETIFRDAKGKRQPPKILIIPGVGTGMSWQDRIMIPLFAPPTVTPEIATLRTLGSYRWFLTTQSYNWKDMPEQLGAAYRLIYPDISFTDLQKSFIEDYVTWMTREYGGFQVLPAEVRTLFWKKIPFADEHKRKLCQRSAAYKKLYDIDKRTKR